MTSFAMVVASAPGYSALTVTIGGVIGGYCSMGRNIMDAAPVTTRIIDSTEANIGLFIKNLLNIVVYLGYSYFVMTGFTFMPVLIEVRASIR